MKLKLSKYGSLSKEVFIILLLVLLFATCKKDDEIYTEKNAVIHVSVIIDTIFTISLTPNPCDSSTNINLKFPKASLLKISVLDIVGRILYQPNITLQLSAGQHQFGIETKSYLQGVYFVRCELDEGKTMTIKMLVVH